MNLPGNWGIIEMVGEVLKEERMSGTGFVLVLLLAYGGYLWAANQHNDFVNKQELEDASTDIKEDISNLAEQVEELKKVTDLHVEEYRIGAATQAVRNARLDLIIAQLAGASTDSLHHLTDEIDIAIRYEQCLIERRSNCKHILKKQP